MHEESLETSCVRILKLHTFRVGSLECPVNLCKYVCICICALCMYMYIWQANLHHQCELNHADGMSP